MGITPVPGSWLGLFDVGRLRFLVATAKQNHHNVAATVKINPVSRSKVEPQFADAIAKNIWRPRNCRPGCGPFVSLSRLSPARLSGTLAIPEKQAS